LHVYICHITLKSGNLQREADIGRIEIKSWLINSIFKFSRNLLWSGLIENTMAKGEKPLRKTVPPNS
jgi:hypothetical protein